MSVWAHIINFWKAISRMIFLSCLTEAELDLWSFCCRPRRQIWGEGGGEGLQRTQLWNVLKCENRALCGIFAKFIRYSILRYLPQFVFILFKLWSRIVRLQKQSFLLSPFVMILVLNWNQNKKQRANCYNYFHFKL